MARGTAGLKTHIWNNNLRSALLLVSYPFLIAGLVWVCGYIFHVTMTSGYSAQGTALTFANTVIFHYWPSILTIVTIWFIAAYLFQTKMVRALSHAHPVTREEERDLYNLLENLCISRGMAMPRLEIIETDALNAFASGTDERTFCVTVTRGLLNTLQKDELEAVLAHELTHIMNRDVRLLIVSIIFTGMIGFFAQLAWSSVRFGMYRRSRRSEGSGRFALLMLAIVAVLWLGYMATLFTRFALSRRREYMADAGSVELTKNPDAMMRALLRISGRDKIPNAPADIHLMCIENTQRFFGLFATHPPIAERIRAISNVTSTPIPDLSAAPEKIEQRPDKNPKNPWL